MAFSISCTAFRLQQLKVPRNPAVSKYLTATKVPKESTYAIYSYFASGNSQQDIPSICHSVAQAPNYSRPDSLPLRVAVKEFGSPLWGDATPAVRNLNLLEKTGLADLPSLETPSVSAQSPFLDPYLSKDLRSPLYISRALFRCRCLRRLD